MSEHSTRKIESYDSDTLVLPAEHQQFFREFLLGYNNEDHLSCRDEYVILMVNILLKEGRLSLVEVEDGIRRRGRIWEDDFNEACSMVRTQLTKAKKITENGVSSVADSEPKHEDTRAITPPILTLNNEKKEKALEALVQEARRSITVAHHMSPAYTSPNGTSDDDFVLSIAEVFDRTSALEFDGCRMELINTAKVPIETLRAFRRAWNRVAGALQDPESDEPKAAQSFYDRLDALAKQYPRPEGTSTESVLPGSTERVDWLIQTQNLKSVVQILRRNTQYSLRSEDKHLEGRLMDFVLDTEDTALIACALIETQRLRGPHFTEQYQRACDLFFKTEDPAQIWYFLKHSPPKLDTVKNIKKLLKIIFKTHDTKVVAMLFEGGRNSPFVSEKRGIPQEDINKVARLALATQDIGSIARMIAVANENGMNIDLGTGAYGIYPLCSKYMDSVLEEGKKALEEVSKHSTREQKIECILNRLDELGFANPNHVEALVKYLETKISKINYEKALKRIAKIKTDLGISDRPESDTFSGRPLARKSLRSKRG